MTTAPAKNAAAELRVVCSRGHDEHRPLRIVDVLLRPYLDDLSATFYGIAGNGTAQQRGGNDADGRHMGAKGQTRLRCPVCRSTCTRPSTGSAPAWKTLADTLC